MADGADKSQTLALLSSAGGGMGKWDWSKAAMPVIVGTLAGGATLVLSEWWLADQFKKEDGTDDEGAWWMRAGAKFLIGVLGFVVLRKVYFPAALGVGIAGGVGAMHDVLVAPEGPFKLNTKLDEWFSDDETADTTTSGGGTNGAAGPMRARNVLAGMGSGW